jgi:magnesium transporter
MDTDEKILEAFIYNHSLEAAQILEELEPEEVAILFREIPVDLAARALEPMYAYKASCCLERVDQARAKELLEKVDLKTAELILRQVEEPLCNSLLENVSGEISGPLRQKLKYPENTVGTLMDPMVFSLREDVTLEKALALLKEHKRLVSPYVFVVKTDKTLYGVVNLQDLLLADKEAPISTLANTGVPKLYADVEFETAFNHDGWLDFYALPVIDRSDILVGSLKLEAVRKASVKGEEALGKQAIKASAALGELYRIGLTGLFRSPGE